MRIAWNPATVAQHVVGNALVLHTGDEISAEAQAFALDVAPDPDRDIVVLDLPAVMPAGAWEAMGETLQKKRRPLRVIVSGAARETAVLAGQWLADRIERPVVAPDGRVTRAGGGMLFVHGAGEGSGWIAFEPGRPPTWVAKRYPAPPWDALVAESLPTSAGGVAEPVPGGVWVHPTGHDAATATHRRWLVETMPSQPDAVIVVVGCPGTPALALDDVARLWRSLGPEVREQARFVRYGAVRLPEDVSFGQALADLLASPVVCLAGIPNGRPGKPAMYTVAADGTPGWQVFARELRYKPRPAPVWPGEAPQILSYRAPEELGEPIAARQFRYAVDSVVEIVESGLWVRGDQITTNAYRPRGRAMDPDQLAVLVDDGDPRRVARLRELAEDLVGRLDRATQQRTGFFLASTWEPLGTYAAEEGPEPPVADVAAIVAVESPATKLLALHPAPAQVAGEQVPAAAGPGARLQLPAPTEPGARPQVPASAEPGARSQVPAPAEPGARLQVPAPAKEEQAARVPGRVVAEPATSAPAFFFQNAPDPSCRAIPDPEMIEEDRAWMRENFGDQYSAGQATVERILAGYSGFEAEADLVADATALHMFLSSIGVGLSEALRDGTFGPQVPFGRCVSSGLERMPEHEGTAFVPADLTAEQLSWIGRRGLLTEWGFTEALAQPAGLTGTVDVFIWSLNGRRTQPLESDGGYYVDGRVVFLPGTRFQVLRAVAPAGGVRGRLLLRQLTSDAAPDPLSEDVIVAELERIAAQWIAAKPRAKVGNAAHQRLTAVPGVR